MNLGSILGVSPPKTSKFPKTTECVNPALIIGMELEVEGCEGRSSDDLKDACRKSNFSITTDGSLRGVAYEFISKPMESTYALAALERFLTLTKFDDSNYSDRCSVHVHVNCTDLEPEQVAGVTLLYSVVEDILFEYIGHDRDTNIYCIPWNQCRSHWDLVHRFLGSPRDAMHGWNKYTAVNLLPLSEIGTIEFRQMYGTADMSVLSTWINIIGSLFKMGTTTPLNDLIAQIKDLNTSSHYHEFFNQLFGSLLPYNDTYRQKLEEGVIYAKFSLTRPRQYAKMVAPGTATAPPPRAVEAVNAAIERLSPRGFAEADAQNVEYVGTTMGQPRPRNETAARVQARNDYQHRVYRAAPQMELAGVNPQLWDTNRLRSIIGNPATLANLTEEF